MNKNFNVENVIKEYEQIEKANEILTCTSKLKEIADELYKNGCEPEDLIVYEMRSYIQEIEKFIKGYE